MAILPKAFVTGAGMTRFGVLEDSITELAVNAATRAVEDSGSIGKDIDYLIIGSQNPAEFTGIDHLSTLLADCLGIVPAAATRVETGPSSGASAFEEAFALVKAGLADLVLVIGVEKMSKVNRSIASRILAKMMSYENETRYGATPAALAAMMARRYMHDYGVTREQLSLVPAKAHRNGHKNHLAHFQKEITVQEVTHSRKVADPLTLFDCCPTSDGAAAAVVVSEEKARELRLLKSAAEVIGVGHATDYLAVQHRQSLTSMSATIEAAARAYDMAKIEPHDVDVCEVHDAFSVFELINMEDLGLANRGAAIHMVADGTTEVDGSLPVNPTGGLKARGHPTGATGLAQIRDAFNQLMMKAPEQLQTGSPEVALCHNIGGFGNNIVVTILERR
ncbi:MAG: thiolase domain-containing protein [Candidatus Thorarchaeota archaeon]